MLKRKRWLDVLGVKHKVRHLKFKGEEAGCEGFYDTQTQLIEISNEIQDQTKYNQVLMHEGFHGVLHLNGSAQDLVISQEHAIIDSFITFLYRNFEIKLKD